jgi:hypothetical protein
LNFYLDFSNLLVAFSQVFEQTRSKVPQLGCRGCGLRRNKKRPRPETFDPVGA